MSNAETNEASQNDATVRGYAFSVHRCGCCRRFLFFLRRGELNLPHPQWAIKYFKKMCKHRGFLLVKDGRSCPACRMKIDLDDLPIERIHDGVVVEDSGPRGADDKGKIVRVSYSEPK